MKRERIRSKILSSIGYGLFNGILHLEFKQPPGTYDFYNVPVGIYIGLMHSSSKMRYFNKYIRNQYVFEELKDSAEQASHSKSGTSDLL